MVSVSFLAAFGAGLISFLSPCVLPLIPGYISFISGISLEELRSQNQTRDAMIRVIMASVSFVLGFSTMFVALGATASFIGQFLLANSSILNKVAGIIIILFGLHIMEVFKINLLYREKRIQTKKRPRSFLGAYLVGLAFAFGWTPCVGPILGGILLYAGTQETLQQGITLLTIYSLGLGIPFIITGVMINRFSQIFNKIKRGLRLVEIIGGLLLIVLGILIFTNNLTWIAGYAGYFNKFSF